MRGTKVKRLRKIFAKMVQDNYRNTNVDDVPKFWRWFKAINS